MAPQQVQWGTITLHLDNEAFRKGFLDARRWYFLDIYGEKGRAPEEPERATTLHSADVLRLIAVPDEQGRYHLGAEACEDIAECLGYLVGYLGGPLALDEAKQYRKEQAQQDDLRRPSQFNRNQGREALSSFSPLRTSVCSRSSPPN